VTTVTFTTSGTWTAPAGVSTTDCQCWGNGGNGAAGVAGGSSHAGGGGGGGEFAEETALAVTASSNYSYTIGAGGSATDTSFPGNSVTVTAHAGGSASGTGQGTAGSGSTNSVHFSGGHGGSGIVGSTKGGAGGGSSAGTGSAGTAGNNSSGGTSGAAGGSAPSGGGNGGNGANSTGNSGFAGGAPGGGGGGGSTHSPSTGGAGAAGQVTLTYTATVNQSAVLSGEGTLTAQGGPAGIATLSGVGTLTAARAGSGNATLPGVGTLIPKVSQVTTAALAGVGTLTAQGGNPTPAVVNQWANSYGQGNTFGSTMSALQSCVVGLSPANSAGPGTGVPSAGNWLFAIASWTQVPQVINVHTGVSDDTHQWWRQFPASGSGQNVRTSVSYVPNIGTGSTNSIVPQYVYVAPDMSIAAINVLVVEISGLGAWDTVTGKTGNYTASGTSVSLSLGAPSAAAFTIAGVGGDNVAAGQAFAPATWTTLATLSQTNGTDHTVDNILTSAILPSTNGSVSVSGTSSSAEDLSGYLLQVLVAAPSPIPATQNANWPYTFFEAAFGAGFNTPNSELTWTDLTNRLWSWDETSGIQYQLGQLQSTNLNIELDNFDGALTPDASPWSFTVAGTPVANNYFTVTTAQSASISVGDGFTDTTNPGKFFTVTNVGVPFAGFVNVTFSPNATSPMANPSGTGSITSPGTYQIFLSVPVSPGTYTVSWSVSLSGTVGAAEANNFAIGTNSGSGVTTQSVNAGAVGTYPQNPVTITTTGADSIVIKSWGSTPTTGAVYGGTLTCTNEVASQASLTAGTPIRLRMALGTLGGRTFNRWCIIQRNAHEWEGELTSVYRRWCPVSGTDMWSSMSSTPPTFYRSEVYEDAPGWWWPMDDQPQESGVLPVSLLNAASGSTKVLSIAASSVGVTAQDTYGFNGTDITATVIAGGFFTPALSTPPAGNVATYAVGTNSGWMYGDPTSQVPSISTAGNPVEPSPGSASWQQSGLLGTGGSHGWYLICNDSTFPGLSGGITVKGWFNVGLFGSGSGYAYVPPSSTFVDTSLCGQPYSPITICELATATAPVAILQLDINGHLNLITYNGSTGTSHSIYSASDLRNNSWVAVDMTLTTTTWEVMLNGGLTADVSGSATGMTSAWTYLILNGDFGSGGGGNPGGLQNGGNMSLSHWAIFPYILPDWRILAHYTAAITGFGHLPAPIGTAVNPVSSPPTNIATAVSAQAQNNAGYQTTPDGQFYDGSYGNNNNNPAQYTFSLVTTANAGGYSSGPSARVTSSGIGQVINHNASVYNTFGFALWLSWTGVAPDYNVYSSATAGAEKLMETIPATGSAVTSGYGAGTSPPASVTPLGDGVGQRIERLMRAGRCTSPQRSIDPASDLVQAPGTSGGGQATSSSVQAIQQSDGGFLFVDNPGYLTYWMRSHLASQYSSPVWTLTPNAPPAPGASVSAIPYYPEYRLVNDPQRIFNVVTVQPFSPSGAQLPLRTPVNSSGVKSSQIRYGAQPLAVTSWLQDQSVMQAQADFLFANFGTPQTRAENVRIDAAPFPAAWNLIAGINVGDVVTFEEWQLGGGGQVLTLRVTEINRKIRFGGQNNNNAGEGEVTASVELTCDFEPSSYY
jgi:hypothetical protein